MVDQALNDLSTTSTTDKQHTDRLKLIAITDQPVLPTTHLQKLDQDRSKRTNRCFMYNLLHRLKIVTFFFMSTTCTHALALFRGSSVNTRRVQGSFPLLKKICTNPCKRRSYLRGCIDFSYPILRQSQQVFLYTLACSRV